MLYDLHQVQWADACLVVYAITDRKSFLHAAETLAALHKVRQGAGPLALLANKADLEHLREVNSLQYYLCINTWKQFQEIDCSRNKTKPQSSYNTNIHAQTTI